MTDFNLDYDLIDSGDGEKLERFGSKLLIRPCSTAVWQKQALNLWKKADACFLHNSGWQFFKQEFEKWNINLGDDLKLALHLQRNGQIGMFPEHFNYVSSLALAIDELKKQYHEVNVLNLFAYTGMASLVCQRLGVKVTHIDKAKAVLSWAKENLELNHIDAGVRLIPEDVLRFLEREKKRNHVYQLIIADPPNFSRISSNENWDLDRVIIDLVKAISGVLSSMGYLFISSHQSFGFAETVNNLLYDLKRLKDKKLTIMPLNLQEKTSKRFIPAGIISFGQLL